VNPVARELVPARLRSSRKLVGGIYLLHRGAWFWGCFATQREQAPSPQEIKRPDQTKR